MENQIFETKIRGDHNLASKEYVLGRITGIQYVLCEGLNQEFPLHYNPDTGSQLIKCYCTKEEYDKFANMIEYLYPGLCVFNYQERYN